MASEATSSYQQSRIFLLPLESGKCIISHLSIICTVHKSDILYFNAPERGTHFNQKKSTSANKDSVGETDSHWSESLKLGK